MPSTCDRCPCKDACLAWPVFCEWAKAEPPDPVQIRHICDRSRMGSTPPAPAAVHAYPPLATQAASAFGAAVRAVSAAATGQPVLVSDEEQARRMAICRACPDFAADQERCRRCGCGMPLKSRLSREHCPIDKW